MNKIKILLIDDHTLFREALNRWLETEPDLEMAAHCASAAKAAEILAQRPIDIVLLDHDLGTESGLQFVSDVRKGGFAGRILMVTAGMTDAESVKALRLGVSGIFLKHSSPGMLAQAIRTVMAGETWLDTASIQALVEAANRAEAPSRDKPFTNRESEVLRGVFEGFSNKEIGARLDISESSVKAALQQLFQKTGVRTRSQLVRIVLEEYGGEWE